MFKSLRGKFIAIYSAIILCAFIILGTAIPQMIENYFTDQKVELLEREGKIISRNYVIQYYTGVINQVSINEHLEILDDYLSARVWVLDSKGQLLLASGKVRSQRHFTLEEQKLIDEVLEGQTVKSVGAFTMYFGQPMLTVGVPITIDFKVAGIIFMHAPLTEVLSTVNHVNKIIFFSLLCSFFIAMLLITILTKKIIDPLNQMNEAAKAIASGNFDKRVYIETDDEVGQLAGSFNFMAEELGKLEQFRKSFIANISHDFRSPLTSIKGFVQAIGDGTIPIEKQDKYLGIVLDETDRLIKLTNNILDLSNMEANKAELDITKFDINDEIRKLIIGMEQRITSKNLIVDLVFQKEKINVDADIEMIKRVLYNLIDNAVKFVSTNDKIRLETSIKGDKAIIRVTDTGLGISKENIKYIWDRFHKADKSRGKDKKGTGLGLSIVKQIINLHGEDIKVESVIDEGTTFVFTLPLAKISSKKSS